MAEILTDSELDDIANGYFTEMRPNEIRERLLATCRALAAERDEYKKRINLWFGANTCSVCGGQPLASRRECVCGGKGTMQAEFEGLRQVLFDEENKVTELEAQVHELTGVLEEMRDCDEGMGSHCARLLAETLADAELSVIKPRNKAVESFRQRAVRAIRGKGEEWRQQGERWQQKFSRETNPIIARQDMSDRDGAFNHMSAAFAIIELVESLPLNEEKS